MSTRFKYISIYLFVFLFLTALLSYAEVLKLKKITKYSVKNKNREYQVIKEVNQSGKLVQQIITSKGYSEITLDQNEDGNFDSWEASNNGIRVYASYPKDGVFYKVEVEKREKKGFVTANYIFSKSKNKYVLASKGFTKHKVMFRDDIILTAPTCSEDTVLSELSSTYKDILSEINKSKINSDRESLFNLLVKDQKKLLDESCYNKNNSSFETEEERNALLGAIAKVMSSKASDNPPQYLACLKQHGLGIHAARMEAKFFGSLKDGTAITEVQTMGKPLISCEAPATSDVEEVARYNTLSGSINFTAPYKNLKKYETNSPLFKNNQLTFANDTAKSNHIVETTFFHEMLHSSGIETEKIVHAATDCCANPDIATEACNSLDQQVKKIQQRRDTDQFLTQTTISANTKTGEGSTPSNGVSWQSFKSHVQLRAGSSTRAEVIIDGVNDKINEVYTARKKEWDECATLDIKNMCKCNDAFYANIKQDLDHYKNSRCQSTSTNISTADKNALCEKFQGLTDTLIHNLKHPSVGGFKSTNEKPSTMKSLLLFNNFVFNYIVRPAYALEQIITSKGGSGGPSLKDACAIPPDNIPSSLSSPEDNNRMEPIKTTVGESGGTGSIVDPNSVSKPNIPETQSILELDKSAEKKGPVGENPASNFIPNETTDLNKSSVATTPPSTTHTIGAPARPTGGVSQVRELGEVSDRTDFVARTDRSTSIVDAFSDGVAKVADVAIPRTVASDSSPTYSTTTHRPSRATTTIAKDYRQTNGVKPSAVIETPQPTNATVNPMPSNTFAEPKHKSKPASKVSAVTTSTNDNKLLSQTSPIFNNSIEPEKHDPPQPGQVNTTSNRKPSTTATSKDSKYTLSFISRTIESNSNVEQSLKNYEFLKALIQNKIQIIDKKKQIFGSRQPVITYEYSDKEGRYIKRTKQ